MSGRDVIRITNLNYFSIKPYKNHYGDVIGTHLFQVSSVNFNGSVQDMYKAKWAKDAARRTTKMIQILGYFIIINCNIFF